MPAAMTPGPGDAGRESDGVRPLSDEERHHILAGFDRLYHSGFYDDRVFEAMRDGGEAPKLMRSYRDVLDDLHVQESYERMAASMDMPSVSEFTDLEEYLDERSEPTDEVVFSVKGEDFSYPEESLRYYAADALASSFRLWAHVGRRLGRFALRVARGRNRQVPPVRTGLGSFTEDEVAILERKYVYLPLPSMEDAPFGLVDRPEGGPTDGL